jgi:2-dehydro-3-deoxygluconokinase
MAELHIKSKDECRYDAIALGEVMMRIDPMDVPTPKARNARIWHGGGETNVAEGLSYCFGFKTAVVTALVDDGIGRNIENQLLEAGVDTSHIIWFNTKNKGNFSTDEKGTLMNGINFTYIGKGVIPSKTEYYRAHTPIREIKPGDIKWDEIMPNTRSFHCGGIFTLISPNSPQVALEAYKKAEQYGVFKSFDLNYRSKVEPDKEKARGINKSIVPYVDFLVGNQSDFFDALGYESKPVKNDDPFEVWLESYSEMLRKVAKDFPNLKMIGTQLRGALTADRINWSAVLYDVQDGKICQAVVRENIEIADRTGGGDSFMSGVIAAILNGKSSNDAVQWGAAHGILVQETPGDTTMVKQSDVEVEVKRAMSGGGVSALR